MQITTKIAHQVGLPLNAAERSWARAVADGAEVLAAIMQGALHGKVPIEETSARVEDSLRSLAHLGSAGRSYAALHSGLSDLARRSGLEPSMFGETTGPQSAIVPVGDTVVDLPRAAQAA